MLALHLSFLPPALAAAQEHFGAFLHVSLAPSLESHGAGPLLPTGTSRGVEAGLLLPGGSSHAYELGLRAFVRDSTQAVHRQSAALAFGGVRFELARWAPLALGARLGLAFGQLSDVDRRREDGHLGLGPYLALGIERTFVPGAALRLEAFGGALLWPMDLSLGASLGLVVWGG